MTSLNLNQIYFLIKNNNLYFKLNNYYKKKDFLKIFYGTHKYKIKISLQHLARENYRNLRSLKDA